MISPNEITNFNRTEAELEEFLLFCILVAGKKAKQTAEKLESFLFMSKLGGDMSPFDWIEHLLKLEANGIGKTSPLLHCMETHKLGQYNRLYDAFKEIIQFKNNLKNVTLEELENVKGIGPKTSRFFLLYSRENTKCCVLDTHLLSHMREDLGIKTPKSTPSNKKKYKELEDILLKEIEKSGKTHAEYDLDVWKKRSNKENV